MMAILGDDICAFLRALTAENVHVDLGVLRLHRQV